LVLAPGAWAQPIEIANPVELTSEVNVQIEQLIAEVSTSDPALAEAIRTESTACLTDLGDGVLEGEITHDIEATRQVQQELTGQVVQAELEAQIAQATAAGNTALAEHLQNTAKACAVLTGTEGAEAISREEARTIFEQAYREALQVDAAGAERMKEMFEAAERGEFAHPDLETMERMQQEMERYVSENPERAEYCRAEWDRLVEFGQDTGDRYGSTDTMERAQESFERWALESGATASEIERMEAMMHEWETNTVERDTTNILDNNLDMMGGGGSGGGGGEVLVATHDHNFDTFIDEWHYDTNGDNIADHSHPAPH